MPTPIKSQNPSIGTIRNPLIQKVGFCKVISFLEGCLDLILSPSTSLKIQIKVGKIVKKSGVQIFFYPFSFHFQILQEKQKYLFRFLNNKIRYQTIVRLSFVWRIWKWKEKRTKKYSFRSRDSNPRFSNISAHDLNYWRWWNQIQARKLKFFDFNVVGIWFTSFKKTGC